MRLPQSLLFQAEHIPHYINYRTKSKVLRAYRRLHRSLNRLGDTLARPHLKQWAQHSFAAYKYVSSTERVLALLRVAEQRELLWARQAAELSPKDLFKTLQLAFNTYKVKETPLKRILRDPPRLCDHSSLVYKLNNVAVPSARTFAEHAEQKRAKSAAKSNAQLEPFWQLVHLLKSNNIRTGANGRKLIFEPEDCHTTVLTVFGEPVAVSRQANILRQMYSTLLRDAPRPVHPEVMQHIEQLLRHRVPPRKYMRRIQHLAQELYTVDHEGKMTGLKFGPVHNLLGIPTE